MDGEWPGEPFHGTFVQGLPDGATVETGDSDYEPDALVNCGEPMPTTRSRRRIR